MVQLLIVDLDPALCSALANVCGPDVSVTTCCDFESAHAFLLAHAPDILVTNLRLAEYNGLHLITLAFTAGHPTRAILHTDSPDYLLIGEAQKLGAMYEPTQRLPLALPAYLSALWPDRDRRDPRRDDRRTIYRGGRRAYDVIGPALPASV